MRRALFFLLLVSTAFFAYLLYVSPTRVGRKEGGLAPSFQLRDEKGLWVKLENLRGQVVLLNFWATWCPPCREEIPSLNALSSKSTDNRFHVLGVNVDEGGWAAIDHFRRSTPVQFQVLSDPQGQVSDLYEAYELPMTFLIGKRGNIIQKFLGPRYWMEPAIQSLIISAVNE